MDQGYGGEYADSYEQISMSIEDIIEFLGKIEEEASASQIAAGRARAGMSNSEYASAGSGLNLK